MIDCLMMIDDSEIDQRLFKRLIGRSGLVRETIGFTMAEEALDHLARTDRKAVDAILLDINMPRMNGFEFLEAAKARFGDNFARVVVVMLTTSLAEQDVQRAAATGVVTDYFNKPLTLHHLEHLCAILGGTQTPASPEDWQVHRQREMLRRTAGR